MSNHFRHEAVLQSRWRHDASPPVGTRRLNGAAASQAEGNFRLGVKTEICKVTPWEA
jgi:hypothetical protein